MGVNTNTSICGLPSWIGIVRNDTAACVNDILLATVNGSSAIFAFLSNLAIIVAVIKNPSLQKPCNILLCSLAFADCLTGVSTQPLFVVWRFFFSRAWQSCLHQVLMFNVYYTFNIFTTGLSFFNVIIISFDRYYALSRPLEYFAKATLKGECVLLFSFGNLNSAGLFVWCFHNRVYNNRVLTVDIHCIRIELEFCKVLVFAERGKPEHLEKHNTVLRKILWSVL